LVEKNAGKFDAVYLAIGAQLIHAEDFQQDNSVYIKDAFGFFEEIKTNSSPYVRKKVIVYGGGKLALVPIRV
jgi:NADPH-dependent glutamate synthase beta subunit-like oxidoreductase